MNHSITAYFLRLFCWRIARTAPTVCNVLRTQFRTSRADILLCRQIRKGRKLCPSCPNIFSQNELNNDVIERSSDVYFAYWLNYNNSFFGFIFSFRLCHFDKTLINDWQYRKTCTLFDFFPKKIQFLSVKNK